MGRPAKKQTGISLGYCDTATGQRVYPPGPEPSEQPDLLPEQIPPPQGSSGNVNLELTASMFADITCWPPLGQTTVISEGSKGIHFRVLLSTSSDATGDVDVRVWHNHATSGDWSETPLKRETGNDKILITAKTPKHANVWYSGTLPISDTSRPTSFTVKFQTPGQKGWKWIRDQSGIADGRLLFTNPSANRSLKDLFAGLSDDISITTPHSESPETQLFSIAMTVAAAQGDQSGIRRVKLGYPNNSTKWFALVQLWAPWLAPRQGAGKFELDKDAVLVSFLRSDGFNVVLLAISGIQNVTTMLVHDDFGDVVISGRNDGEQSGTARVLVASGHSFEAANSAVMYEARKMVANNAQTTSQLEQHLATLPSPTKQPKSQWFQEWYDGFTFCTWNALGQDLTEDKITKTLKDLKDAGIEIENLIIDDNWQSITDGPAQFDRGWTSFEANKKGFPNGLKSAISKIRSDHPNIKHIAVWHALMGYWGAISPNGELAKNYKTTIVNFDMPVIQGPRTVVAGSDINKMYNDFYEFLSSCGVDSVKTDVQFYLDTIISASARRELTTAYQDAWTLAQLRHMSARSISCMSQSPSILFHSQLPNNRPTIPVRNSDDFFPEVDASHPWHIFCNAHNSLLTQHLNVVPDWDMFQTDHPWGSFHAAARCVSGGPIYFTDTPGHHDIKLINQMTARTPDEGRRVILRTHTIGKSIDPYTGYRDPAFVKIGTYVGYARTGTAILGVFNCLETAHRELIRLSSFPGAAEGVEYVVRAFRGEIFKPMLPEDKASVMHVQLDPRGWEILSAHPVHAFDGTKVALLGLVSHMVGIAGVLGYSFHQEPSGRVRLWVNLKALGTLGVWISDLPSKSVDSHIMVLLGGAPVPRNAVAVSQLNPHVLEIDYEAFWEDDHAGAKTVTWGNEVSLEVFINP